ncbi:MAG TPA: lanthionine synthetase C family protein [Thermoanaerobaculia bacterium]|nr:lanthionine synthetase C family protein [Thermoanaerobaculia bacterium]
MDHQTGWQPILAADRSERVLDVVEEIAGALTEMPAELRGHRPAKRVSLAAGLAGQALFYSYLELARPDKGWGDRAVELLEQAMAELSDLPADQSLYSGFVGVAWVLEHLHDQLVGDGNDPGEEIVGAVERALLAPPGHSGFDLISGFVGLGVYARERLPRPGAERCLRRVVERLEESAERRDGTAAWKTPPEWVPPDRRAVFPQGYCFTGAAHGAAGVISFLAEAHSAGAAVRPLLDEAVAWLLTAKLPPGSGSVYPYEVAPGAASQRPTRLAWCHGDPGIAAALLGAARRAGEADWEREAVELACSAASRSRQETTVIDAGLCHGSAGLAHLFNRMFQATGDPALAAAARYWLDRTLDLRRPGQGVAGFMAWENDENLQLGWRAEPGFLTGAAGVGLALLGAAAPVEPAWDRLLLAS